MRTIRSALHSTFAAKYIALYPVCATSTLIGDKSIFITVLRIKEYIFTWSYLRCCSRDMDNSLRVILHICCQIQLRLADLYYVNSGSCQIQCNYGSALWGLNIELVVSPLLLQMYEQLNARYTPHLQPNTAHVNRFVLCQLWILSNPMQIQLRIFKLHYSIDHFSVDIGYMWTIRCALCGTIAVKCRASAPVYAMSTVATVKSNVITVPQSQFKFNRWYLRCYWKCALLCVDMRNYHYVGFDSAHGWHSVYRLMCAAFYCNCGV
jgi:hypothetical protein